MMVFLGKDLQKPEAKVGKADKNKQEKAINEEVCDQKDNSDETNSKEGGTPYGWTKLEEESNKSEEEAISENLTMLKYVSNLVDFCLNLIYKINV